MFVSPQEALGLDILVHGEAERTDMVEFFAQQFEGFAFTSNGWVQVRKDYSLCSILRSKIFDCNIPVFFVLFRPSR